MSPSTSNSSINEDIAVPSTSSFLQRPAEHAPKSVIADSEKSVSESSSSSEKNHEAEAPKKRKIYKTKYSKQWEKVNIVY